MALVAQFKRLRNVAGHSWTGAPRSGWSEFDRLDIQEGVWLRTWGLYDLAETLDGVKRL